MRAKISLLAATGLIALAVSAGSPASATNDLHESYVDQLQKNPRLIEPGNERLRYTVGDPRDGYDERVARARGYRDPDEGYDYSGPRRGRVVVRPY
jgi:hypothetical protein